MVMPTTNQNGAVWPPQAGQGAAQPAPANRTSSFGRDRLPWPQSVWDRIDRAVADEMARTCVARKFLPICRVDPGTTNVPSDEVTVTEPQAGATNENLTLARLKDGIVTIKEDSDTNISEFWVEFELTPAQVENEMSTGYGLDQSTAVTAAMRAAKYLAQAEDHVIFHGMGNATAKNEFVYRIVHTRDKREREGLLRTKGRAAASVSAKERTGEESKNAAIDSFTKILEQYSNLQSDGYSDPFALALGTRAYREILAIQTGTLITPADRLRPLMTAGLYGTGTLDPDSGLLVSLGGNSMDLVVGMDATTTFVQQDVSGAYRFRVAERFALRLKVKDAAKPLDLSYGTNPQKKDGQSSA